MIITIDGPSGAGKGTISRRIASTFALPLLDSGALYRLAALSAVNAEIDISDDKALAELAESMRIVFRVDGESTRTLLNDEDVSLTIRSEQIGLVASKIAPVKALRAALLQRQRAFANDEGLVADGRDMGTVVFPTTPYKYYLTASAEERARRRVKQLEDSGAVNVDYQQIHSDICARDERDMKRASSPLVPADDAIQIDSTDLSIDDVVSLITRDIQRRM